MRTGIVYMVATVLCIFVTSCFTGVESTKKITMPDTGEIAAQSPEDRFIESYFVQQGCDTWRIGKPFYYTDEKLSFVFRPEKPTFPDSISLKGKIFTYAGSIEESPFGGDDKVVLLFDCEGHKFRYETGKTREEIGRLKYTPLIPPFIDIDDLNMARSLLKDRVLYIKTPMWYNEKSEAIEGRKLIPVRVVDIRPGNNVLPVEVWFEDDKGNQAGVFMSLLSSSRSQYITFDRLFSFENPRLQYKESGFFPEWASPGHRGCMIGNNSASILVDAYFKGVKVDDLETLYKGLIHGTENVHPEVSSTGRLGYEYYNKLGYVPYDVKINENAARTLEYAYNDWCIYKLAKDLKRPKKEVNLFAKRAMNYRNLFDKETLLMRGKNKDGKFMTPFSPLKWGDAFTEGNSWHYSWSVFHDPQGLIDLMGGDDMFVTMMDSVFSVPPVFDDSYYGFPIHEIREMTVMNMGNYAHGNQPIQHMIYLYNYAKQPWKAQYWLRQVMDRMYTPTPDGYCGDEDNGQTSAWYVFSALGFYPVCPGTDQYVLGAPLFQKATIHFENGKNIVINAPQNSETNYYIQDMKVNGQEYTKNYITHSTLQNGGTIDYVMGDKPNKNRGIAPEDAPYSFSKELKK